VPVVSSMEVKLPGIASSFRVAENLHGVRRAHDLGVGDRPGERAAVDVTFGRSACRARSTWEVSLTKMTYSSPIGTVGSLFEVTGA